MESPWRSSRSVSTSHFVIISCERLNEMSEIHVPRMAFKLTKPRASTRVEASANLGGLLLAAAAGPLYVERPPARQQPWPIANRGRVQLASGRKARTGLSPSSTSGGVCHITPPAHRSLLAICHSTTSHRIASQRQSGDRAISLSASQLYESRHQKFPAAKSRREPNSEQHNTTQRNATFLFPSRCLPPSRCASSSGRSVSAC